MFAAAFSSSRSAPALANAYRRVGVETGVSGASPHKLVQMLFDGFQDAVLQARGALAQRSTEAKGNAIRRALGILDDGLMAGLDMQRGGQIAANLSVLYAYISVRLTHANIHNDDEALDECARLIEPIRTAWIEIGPQVNSPRQ